MSGLTPTFSLEGFSEKDVPMLLLPYQQKWVADTSGFKLWSKSRRIGASWAEAGDAALLAAQAKGSNAFYLGFSREMTLQFCMDCAEWAKLYHLAASEIEETEDVFRDGNEEKAIQVFRIWFNSGYRIETLSSEPRNLRSKQGRVIIDEAAFHDDLTGVLKAAKALRLWGSSIHVITTYNGIEGSYYALEQDVLSGKFPYSRHFTTFRMAVEEGLYKRICLIKGWAWSQDAEDEWVANTYAEFGEDAAEELDCIPTNASTTYFSRVLVESCMHKNLLVLRLELKDEFAVQSEHYRRGWTAEWLEANLDPLLDLDPTYKTYYGMDFGRSGDLSYLLPLQLLSNLVRRAPFALELRNVPFEQQRQILFYIVDRLPRFMHGAMDARGNGQYLAEVAMQRYGSRISSIMASNEFYGEWFPKYRGGMQDGNIVLPADDGLVDDHRLVRLIGGIPKVPEQRTREKGEGKKPKLRHGDGAIAGLMAWYASCQAGGPIEFQSAGARELAGEAELTRTGFGAVRINDEW